MSLESQISLLTNPREFVRLCDALLAEIHGDDYLAIDDDRSDGGNDGYLKSEGRLFAMHCFKRLQNKGIESSIRSKMLDDLAKAVVLRDEGEWDIREWTFLSNYPMPHSVATKVLEAGKSAGIGVSWRGPESLAAMGTAHPGVLERFPGLQAPALGQRLDRLGTSISSLARAGYVVPDTATHLPVDAIQQQDVVVEQPVAWEYMLFGGVMVECMAKLEDQRFDHELGLTSEPRAHYVATDVPQLVSQRLNDMSRALEPINRLFEPATIELIFGAPGDHGDPARIAYCARRVVRFYEYAMVWAAQMRAVTTHPILDPLLEATAQLATRPIECLREFVHDLTGSLARLPEAIASATPEDQAQLDIILVLDMDDEALERQVRAMEVCEVEIEKRGGWNALLDEDYDEDSDDF